MLVGPSSGKSAADVVRKASSFRIGRDGTALGAATNALAATDAAASSYLPATVVTN